MRSNRSGTRHTRLPIAPAPSEVPTATVAPNAFATASTSRARSSNPNAAGSAGALERPCPRKSNRTLVPGTSGVNAASSLRLFVSPCASTVTGSPSPSTSQYSVASSFLTSGTARVRYPHGRDHRPSRRRGALLGAGGGRRFGDAARGHALRGRSRTPAWASNAGGVRPRLLRLPARPRAEGVDPALLRRLGDRAVLPRVRTRDRPLADQPSAASARRAWSRWNRSCPASIVNVSS